jgi:mannose-1-phosphate guanylyltransferase
LGTAGALKYAAPYFSERALVLNGDTYLDIDYQSLAACHEEQAKHRRIIGTLALVEVQDCTRYGEVVIDKDHRIIGFREKSSLPCGPGLINAGAYVFEPQILDRIPSGRATSLEKEIFPHFVSLGNLQGFVVKGHFVDIGTPEGLLALEELIR